MSASRVQLQLQEYVLYPKKLSSGGSGYSSGTPESTLLAWLDGG